MVGMMAWARAVEIAVLAAVRVTTLVVEAEVLVWRVLVLVAGLVGETIPLE